MAFFNHLIGMAASTISYMVYGRHLVATESAEELAERAEDAFKKAINPNVERTIITASRRNGKMELHINSISRRFNPLQYEREENLRYKRLFSLTVNPNRSDSVNALQSDPQPYSLDLTGGNITDEDLNHILYDLQFLPPQAQSGVVPLDELSYFNVAGCKMDLASWDWALIVKAASNLTSVNFAYYHYTITWDMIAELARIAPNLTEINLSFCNINDKLAKFVAQSFPDLVTLHLEGNNLTDQGIRDVARYGLNITSLNVANNPALTDDAFFLSENESSFPFFFSSTTIKSGFKNLIHLNLENCPLVGDVAIEAIAKASPYLESANLKGCYGVMKDGPLTLAQSCPNLKLFKLSGWGVTNKNIRALAKCTKLAEVYLDGEPLLGATAASKLARGCNELRVIYCSGQNTISDRDLEELHTHCPQLTTLGLNDSMFVFLAGNGGQDTSKTPSLTVNTLDLTKVHLYPHMVQKITRLYPHLKFLKLEDTSIQDPAIQRLRKSCFYLTVLDLTKCRDLTDACLEELSKFPNLTEVNLTGCSAITQPALTVFIQNNPRITVIRD